MAQIVYLNPRISRVEDYVLGLEEDTDCKVVRLTPTQISVLRQMVFPHVWKENALIHDHGAYQEIVEKPQWYKDELECLELALGGGGSMACEEIQLGDVYVDRGDPTGWDFTLGYGLIADDNWHDLDLSAIVTDANATLVHLHVVLMDANSNLHAIFRKNGNVGIVNAVGVYTVAAGVYVNMDGPVALGAGQIIEYWLTTGMDACYFSVRGWWKPGG